MRYPFGLLAGSSLALLVFILLAWLVVPPQAPKPLEEMTLSLTELSDAPADLSPPEPITTQISLPPPPPAVAPPAFAQNTDNMITLPSPELPPRETPEVGTGRAPLPELIETPPAPEPQPKLQPKLLPSPAPSAEPKPQLVAEPAPASLREPVVDVGSSVRPTRRVPPQSPPVPGVAVWKGMWWCSL